MTPASLMGWTANGGNASISIPRLTPDGTYTIGIRGTNQGRTVEGTVTVTVVNDDPTANPPTTRFGAGKQMGFSATPIVVSWPAATDPSSAIDQYQVQRSIDGGPWGGTATVSGTTRSATMTVPLDSTYQFRVRAVDVGGHWSPWAEGGTGRSHAYDDRSSSITRTGTWSKTSSSSAYKGTLLGASRPSRKLSLVFTGNSVGIVAPKSLYKGKARVYIDGVPWTTISFKASVTTHRRYVFTASWATVGTHRISLIPTGTGAYPLIRVDAFVVGR